MNFNWKKLIIIPTLLLAVLIFPKTGLAQNFADFLNPEQLASILNFDRQNIYPIDDQINALDAQGYTVAYCREYMQRSILGRSYESDQKCPQALDLLEQRNRQLDQKLRWYNDRLNDKLEATTDPIERQKIEQEIQLVKNERFGGSGTVTQENQNIKQDPRSVANSTPSKGYYCELTNFSWTGCGMLGLVWIAQMLLWVTSWVLHLAVIIFNFSVEVSVLKFSSYANGTTLPGIEAAWKIARDLANIFFIFILLYVAIKTVLGEGGAQKLVANVIVVALLVNFSAVIPRVIIDASNILALQAYNGIVGEGTDLSQKILDIGMSRSPATINNDYKNPSKDPNLNDDPDVPSRLVTSVGTLIIMLTLTTILIAAAVLFIHRTVVLLVVIIASPLAVMSWALPKYDDVGKRWLKALTNEAIYAPAFLLFLYITLKVFENAPQNIGGSTQDKLAGQIIFFILINSMIAFCMVIAKYFGAQGADRADKMSGKFKGFFTGAAAGAAGTAGVYGFGRTAQKVMDQDWVKNLKKTTGGRLLNDFVLDKTLGRVAGGKYGTSQTYKERIEKEAGRITQFKGAPDQAQYLASLGQTDRAAAWGKLSDRQKAEVLHHIDEVQAGTTTTNLSAAKQQKMILDIKGDGTDTNKGLVPKTGTDAWDKLQDEKDRVKTSQDVKKAREELDKVGTGQHPTMVQIKSSVDLLKGNSVNRVDLDKLLHPDVISNLNGQQLKAISKHSDFNPATAVTTAGNGVTVPGVTVRKAVEDASRAHLGLTAGTPITPANIPSLPANLQSALKYLGSPDGRMNYN